MKSLWSGQVDVGWGGSQIVTNSHVSAQRHAELFLLFWNILLAPDLGLLTMGLGLLLGVAAAVSPFLALL